MKSLSIILPCLNEERNIKKAVSGVADFFRKDGIDGEIIVVNDGSVDGTADVLRMLENTEPLLRVIHHSENRGYGAAVCSGLDAATKQYIAFMDSDGQFDPLDFRLLLPHLDQYDAVVGRRLKRADPFPRKVNAKLFGFLVWAFLGVWVHDINCAMKVFKRSLWQRVRPEHSTGALFNAELFFNLHQNGIPWKQVPVHHYPRKFGNPTGSNLSVILRMFRELWQLRTSAQTPVNSTEEQPNDFLSRISRI